MNYIDILLIVIILIATWGGIQKGFILGITDLIGWAGGLLLTFSLLPSLLKLAEEFVPSSRFTLPLAFIMLLVLTRLILSFLTDLFLKKIPVTAHNSRTNRISGAAPGFVSGLVYASIGALLLLLIPFSRSVNNEAKESKLAAALSENLAIVRDKLGPSFDKMNLSIGKATMEPSSDKFVKLPFKVKNTKTRADLEAKMLLLINIERQKVGLNSLEADSEMLRVARKHSADMYARGYFSHISPEGKTPFDRIRAADVRFIAAGENLALAQTLTLAHTGLMNSPGHKANILHKSFGRVGIGILDGGVYGIMVTQNFRN